MRRIALLCFAAVMSAAEPELQFAGFSAAWFEAGSIISVPQRQPINTAVVRVADPHGLLPGLVRVSMCGEPPSMFSTTASRSGSDEIVRISTSERSGFFGGTETCYIRATSTARGVEFNAPKWTVSRWQQRYLQATFVKPGVTAPTVRLDEPAAGKFTPSGVRRTVVIKGAVLNTGEFAEVQERGGFRISVDGRQVERDYTRGGWAFKADVPLDDGTKEVEIAVVNPIGSTTRLLVPVSQ